MHRFSIPLLTLVLAAPALASAAEPTAGASATASASVTANVKVTDQEALNDDILATIDLPLAAAEARDAGVDETELREALDSTREIGLPASEATEVVTVEAEQTRTRGAKKGFGRWVRLQVAAGLRGKQLASKIKARKEDLKELDDKQRAELEAKIAKQKQLNQAWRQKRLEKRKELLASGKVRVFADKDRHDKFKARIDAAEAANDARQDRVDARQGDSAARLREVDAKLATATGDEKTALEAEKKRLEQQIKRLDKVEDRLEKRDEKLDKIEDRVDSKTGKPIPRPGIPGAKGEAKGDLKAADGKPGKGHKGPADKKGAEAAQ